MSLRFGLLNWQRDNIYHTDVKQNLREKELEEKEKKKKSPFRNVGHKTTKKSFKVIIRDRGGGWYFLIWAM